MQMTKYAFILLALAALLTSCDKDEAIAAETAQLNYLLELDEDALVDELTVAPETELAEMRASFGAGDPEHRFHGDCFTVVFPVDVDFPDGSTETANDRAGLKQLIRDYIAANPAPRRRGDRPRLAFPISIQLADGSLETLDSRRALVAQVRECRPDVERCYTLVFPVEVQVGERTASFEDAAALRDGIRAFRQANPGAERPQLIFPVTVESATGEEVAVESRQDFRRLRRACLAERRAACFTYVFPITIEHRAAGQRTVENAAQLRRAFSHANRRGRWSVVFPIEVTQDGETVAVDSRAELRALRRDCR